MNTRKLLTLGTLVALTSLAGATFAADQKPAAGEKAPAAPAASAQAPAGGEPATPAKPAKKHHKKKQAPETKG